MYDVPQAERYTVRNDYAFKKVFGSEANKDILIEFVSLVTGMDKAAFAEVQLENTELAAQFYDEKTGRLDIKIRLRSGEKIDIEMQNIWFDHFTKRSIFYWTELLTEHFKKGEDYCELHKCIAINILNQPFELSKKIHATYKILETDEHILLDDLFEIHFLDLTKIPVENRNALEKWLAFIQTDDEEVRRMLARENPLMEKAQSVMEEFYTTPEQRALYQAALRYESDRVSMINESLRKGHAAGKQEGIQLGKQEGIQLGKQEGLAEGVRKTAAALKKMGLPMEQIMQATSLTKEEVELL